MSKTVVVLDPGHGGGDPGAVFAVVREKDVNLRYSLALASYLKKRYECTVLLTRTKDVSMTLKERADFANKAKADYFFSVHSNAGRGQGYEDFIFNGSVPARTVTRRAAAHKVISRVWADNLRPNRGKKRANFFVLRETSMCAMLVENGFLDDPTGQDPKLLNDASFQAKLVAGMGDGIADALSLKRVAPPAPDPGEELPAVKRAIDVRFNGEKTNLQGYYVDGETVAGVRRIVENLSEALGVEMDVEGHGSYIDIKADPSVRDAINMLRKIVGLE